MARKSLCFVVYQSHLGPGVTDEQADDYTRRLGDALRAEFPGADVSVKLLRRSQGVGSGLQHPDEWSDRDQDIIHNTAERIEV